MNRANDWRVHGPSRRSAIVVVQHAAESFAAFDDTSALTDVRTGLDDLIVQPLMVASGVIMSKPEFDGVARRLLAKKIIRSRHSRRREPKKRSIWEFKFGDLGAGQTNGTGLNSKDVTEP